MYSAWQDVIKFTGILYSCTPLAFRSALLFCVFFCVFKSSLRLVFLAMLPVLLDAVCIFRAPAVRRVRCVYEEPSMTRQKTFLHLQSEIFPFICMCCVTDLQAVR